jgi:predicted AlkP superfamily pyrophosphatase or phosphodiesterase
MILAMFSHVPGKFIAAILLLYVNANVFASGSGGVNASEHLDKPYLVLISIDGFRWDYQDLYDTPALDEIAAGGVRAERLIPVFPTLTFPNHYSVATGLYPANHGLVGNTFRNAEWDAWYSISKRETVQDGWWYGGEPVWVAAEKAGMVTAAYYFVGTEADIQGVPMTHWHMFDASVPGRDRVEKVLEWLTLPAQQRPHLITLYFEDVDTITHRFGPGSKRSIAAIKKADGYIETLLNGIDALPHGDEVYLVVVSDHGQIEKQRDQEILVIDEVVDTSGLAIVDHGAAAFIYILEGAQERAIEIRDAINTQWAHGKAMLRQDAPQAWRVSENAGFADVIVQADPGYLVFSYADRIEKNSRGDHGWAPEAEGMHGIFLASGPRLPKGKKIGPLSAVDVYPLMMEILGLPITTAIDSDPERLLPLLGQ